MLDGFIAGLGFKVWVQDSSLATRGRRGMIGVQSSVFSSVVGAPIHTEAPNREPSIWALRLSR